MRSRQRPASLRFSAKLRAPTRSALRSTPRAPTYASTTRQRSTPAASTISSDSSLVSASPRARLRVRRFGRGSSSGSSVAPSAASSAATSLTAARSVSPSSHARRSSTQSSTKTSLLVAASSCASESSSCVRASFSCCVCWFASSTSTAGVTIRTERVDRRCAMTPAPSSNCAPCGVSACPSSRIRSRSLASVLAADWCAESETGASPLSFSLSRRASVSASRLRPVRVECAALSRELAASEGSALFGMRIAAARGEQRAARAARPRRFP